MTARPDVPRRRSSLAGRAGLSGKRAERLAALWLMLKGYRIVGRRVGGKGGEIDLIVRRGRVVAFVEVKSRAELDGAMESITPHKQRLIRRRAALWLSRNAWAAGLDLRADAVFIGRTAAGRPALPRHVPALFPLEGL